MNVTTMFGPCPAEPSAPLRVGFVGAGKVGVALGLHAASHGATISGYTSRTQASADVAAKRTGTASFTSLRELLESTDLIFITTPDGTISQVAGELAAAADGDLAGKVVAHASGALGSCELVDARAAGAACASVHPLAAVSTLPADDAAATNPLASAFFTLEGDPAAVKAAEALLDACSNQHACIDAADKVRYHAAAVFMSNLVCGLASEGLALLEECGFTAEQAFSATRALFIGNCEAIAARGPQDALTGPVERNDTTTVARHLEALEGRKRSEYVLLSLAACELTKRRHPERNYAPLEDMLGASAK